MNFYTLTFYVFSSVQRPLHIIKVILEEQTSVRLLRALLGTNGLGNERQYVSLKSSKENNSYVMSPNDFVACNIYKCNVFPTPLLEMHMGYTLLLSVCSTSISVLQSCK